MTVLKVADTAPTAYRANGFADSALNNVNDNTYDAYGNMITDFIKGITTAITYNHLNLPTKIAFGAGNNISYIYNATGQKVQKLVVQGANTSTTDYQGGYQYNNAVLKFFPTAEGFVENEGSSYKYVYQYKDHLGNVRLSYKNTGTVATPTLQIDEENNYYPFGLKHKGYNIATPSTNEGLKYKYNGKELQDELGLNVTAMDYRQYDSAIGRFNSMDKLSELTYDISPYRFALNNPIFWADPTGLSEQNGGNFAICPTCPNTPAFKPLIDDPNNTYVYDPETQTASQVIQLEEVVVQGKPKAKSASDYYGDLEFNYNGLNDVLLGVGATGLKNSYNSNYGKFNSAYYNFYKAMGKSSRLPKPGAQRQLLKRLLSNSKFSASSKLLRRAGIAGAVLTVGNVGLDVAEDGAIKASSIIDGGSLAVLGVATVFCPPCAVGIGAGLLVYGVLDYTFEINDAIDENTEQIQIFDK
jgi:RHS repeat-associated protein